ncbi:sensor histidine kinase [Xaviernesmea oryzae]|nr:PAS domain-containing sensor histidine kinase [Xaviernesmea oryzae]
MPPLPDSPNGSPAYSGETRIGNREVMANSRFMQSVLAASDDCIKILSLEGKLLFMSEGGQRVMEVEDFDALRGCPWPDFWAGAGLAEAQASIAAAVAGRSSRFLAAANTAKGTPKFWDVKVSPIFGADGQPETILSVSRDITELKRSEDEQRLLAQELRHRVKNILMLVRVIANQTIRTDVPAETAREKFSARLMALAESQDRLTSTNGARAELHALLDAVSTTHGGGRLHFSGPKLELNSRCTLAMAMALHELATNAMKYGALSNENGHVEVTWRVVEVAEKGSQFHFTWTEDGGPPVQQPSSTGFGSRLIEKALAGYFLGAARIDYRPGGLFFELEAPMDALTREDT